MSDKRKEYKGYLIEPVPYHTVKGWELNINIIVREGSDERHRNFSAKNCYKTEQEAIEEGYKFGVGIIDGKYDNLSV